MRNEEIPHHYTSRVSTNFLLCISVLCFGTISTAPSTIRELPPSFLSTTII